MNNQTLNCRELEAKLPALLPDLLLDPAALPPAATQHLAGCPPCQALADRELAAHRSTLHLLDTWQAPELTPYFAPRMGALLREEQARPRPGLGSLIDRVRAWFLLTDLHLKPIAAAGALGVILAAGGGAWLDLAHQSAPAPQASATVRDLQSLDENAQVFQQMNSIDAGDDNSEGSSL